MSEQTARLVERLRTRLRRATRRMSWAQLAFGGALAGGTAAALWVLAATVEATLWLQPSLRTGLLVSAGAVLGGIAATFIARPLGRLLGVLSGPSEKDVARTVGEQHPAVADRLVNLLQLAEGQRSSAPAPYVDRAVQHLADQIEGDRFEAVADFQPARRAARWALFPAFAAIAFLFAAPSTFLEASERLLAPRTEFERPAPFQFDVRPGNVQLIRGDSLRVTVQATGDVPETAALLLRPTDTESARRIAIEPDSMGTFQHTVPNVRRALRYRVAASPVRTEWYTVEVARRPVVRRLRVRVTPPDYTDRPSRQLEANVGSVTALPGTEVTVSAALGGASATSARLDFENGASQSLTVSGDSATGRFTLRRADTYALRLESETGIPNRAPIRYELDLQTDARPSVSLLSPDDPAELTPDLTQPLRLRISDDYGVRRATLFYRRLDGGSADSSFASLALSLPDAGTTDQVLSHTWLLAQESGLDLERGDEVAYYVKAWDNDTVNGPKSGRTATQRLRFPSLSEQYEELDTLQQATSEQMQALDRQSKDIQQQFQDLRREVRRTRESDWEEQRQLKQLQQKQEALSQSKSSLSRQVDSLNREMQRNDLSSPETSQKFQELKRTIDEMESEDLQQALESMRQSMQDQSFRQMQSAMEQAQSQLQQQEQQLERTLNLFKQLKARQKMEELSRRAENIRKREDLVAQETSERMDTSSDADSSSTSDAPSSDSTTASPDSSRADGASPPASDSTATARSDSRASQPSPSADSAAHEDLARAQEELAEEMERLTDEMENAVQDMKDVPSAPKKDLQRMRKQTQERDISGQMRQNSQQLRKNQLQNARQQQQWLQKRLQSMQSRMSQMQKQMEGQQRTVNMTGLRSALENTLRLSKDQEDVRTTLEGLEGDDSPVRRFAAQQKDLQDGLNHVADSLQSIANRLPRMSKAVQEKTGNALRAMEDATTALDAREGTEAIGYQKTSMMHLNELARLLSDLLNQMKQQSSGGSGKMSMQQAMQQLQQASGQQQKLNQQIQNFLNEAQGERLSQDLQARRRQLAEQQRQIKKQLDEMDLAEETKQKLMGDLQKIAEEMKQSANDLQDGRHSRDLINRQQQILSRLLNAQQSLRTQGKKQQRRGRQAGDDFDQERPGDRPDSEATDTLRRDLIRALEMGYDSDYEALIKKYFQLLEQAEGTRE
ncbi:DUF4175 family protein [Salinibacter altiplanensis]|uniref:DUF4175 family protein n=1 Tax=Salinibacter altiplanensis TaxID=1803181 RepID=UPI000C9F63A4|nr:DUF4175 family protein [Salinibacter altiplanensis]